MMLRKKPLWIVSCILLMLAGSLAAGVLGFRKPQTVTLRFEAVANGAQLSFHDFVYPNPMGEEVFRIRDFRFYLSNVVLSAGDTKHQVPESYHLIRFDGASSTFDLELAEIPLRNIDEIAFSIGLDAKANGSLMAVGDLDPNSRMAWNWEIGHKFVLLEGAMRIGQRVQPLVYHVGFNENRRDVVLRPKNTKAETITLTVDVLKILDGIDMANLPTVKMDRQDAKRLANNYANMIALR